MRSLAKIGNIWLNKYRSMAIDLNKKKKVEEKCKNRLSKSKRNIRILKNKEIELKMKRSNVWKKSRNYIIWLKKWTRLYNKNNRSIKMKLRKEKWKNKISLKFKKKSKVLRKLSTTKIKNCNNTFLFIILLKGSC